MNWTECGCVRHSSKYSNVVYLEVWSFSSCLGPSQFAFLANNKRKTMGWWKTCRTTSSRSWSFSSNSSPLMSCCWLLLLGCWRWGVGGGRRKEEGGWKGRGPASLCSLWTLRADPFRPDWQPKNGETLRRDHRTHHGRLSLISLSFSLSHSAQSSETRNIL